MADERYIAPIISVNGEWLPGVVGFDCKCADIDREGTTRSEAGIMHRDILRPRVVSAQITHKVDVEGMVAITTALAPAEETDMTVLCPASPNASDGYVSAAFYVSEIETNLIWISEYEQWWEVSYQITEV